MEANDTLFNNESLETTLPSIFGLTSKPTETSETANLFSVVFQLAVVIIGVVGLSANGFVITVSLCQMKKKLLENVLIMNQLTLDLFSCILLTISYSIKLCNAQLTSLTGYYWLCLLFTGETLLWIGITGSVFNLGAVAIERYLKICHSLWHKVHFRPWVAYSAISLVWLCAFVIPIAAAVPTTKIENELCMVDAVWPSDSVREAYGIWIFLSFYVVMIVIFGLCYGQIFAKMKSQQKLFPGFVSIGPVGDNTQQKHAQIKLMKTTFSLTLSFALCWLPNQLCYVVMNTQHNINAEITSYFWYLGLFVGFLNICSNPFIYGAKSVLVKSYIDKFLSRCNDGLSQEHQFEQSHQHSLNNLTQN